jgi:uncharacterized membrane protein
METKEEKHNSKIDNEQLSRPKRRAVNQLSFGSIILLWGSLLILKQAGIIEKNVSTWPYPLAVFGILLVISGIYRLNRLHTTTC